MQDVQTRMRQRQKRFTSRWQSPESKVACFLYNYTIINYLLILFVHKYYAQPIYYMYVS